MSSQSAARIDVLVGDSLALLRGLPAESFQTCVTSPPYFGLRDYGVPGQIGLEDTPDAYVRRLVEVFREVRRVLRPDGTLWLNIGDSYAGGGRGGNGGLVARADSSGPASAGRWQPLSEKLCRAWDQAEGSADDPGHGCAGAPG